MNIYFVAAPYQVFVIHYLKVYFDLEVDTNERSKNRIAQVFYINHELRFVGLEAPFVIFYINCKTRYI